MQPLFQKLACLSILSLAVACGRYEPGDYTSTGGTGQTGGSHSSGNSTDKNDASDPTTDCPADTDGSRTKLPFAIVEIGLGPDGFIEFLNPGDEVANVLDFELHGAATWSIPEDISGHQRLLFDAVLDTSGELALLSDKGVLTQYVCWGQQPPTNHQNEAVAKGLWSASAQCVETPEDGQSLHLTGNGRSPLDWKPGPPNPSECL